MRELGRGSSHAVGQPKNASVLESICTLTVELESQLATRLSSCDAMQCLTSLADDLKVQKINFGGDFEDFWLHTRRKPLKSQNCSATRHFCLKQPNDRFIGFVSVSS